MTEVPGVAQRCLLCHGAEFAEHRFSLLRCTDCGLVVNPAILRYGFGEVLNDETFRDAWKPETPFWVRWFECRQNRR